MTTPTPPRAPDEECANCLTHDCREADHGNLYKDGSCDKHPLYCRGFWPRSKDRRGRKKEGA